jgi:hypothetical protein
MRAQCHAHALLMSAVSCHELLRPSTTSRSCYAAQHMWPCSQTNNIQAEHGCKCAQRAQLPCPDAQAPEHSGNAAACRSKHSEYMPRPTLNHSRALFSLLGLCWIWMWGHSNHTLLHLSTRGCGAGWGLPADASLGGPGADCPVPLYI